MRLIGRILKAFIKDDCFSLSANISFCALLAVIPLMMIVMSITGYFLGSQVEIFNQVVDAIVSVLPIGREYFVKNLTSLLEQKSSFGIIGIFTLLFIVTILVSSIEKAFDIIFRSVTRRNFFHSRLIGIALIFGITILFFIPTMIRVLEGLLKRFGFNFPFGELFVADLFIFVVSFLAFIFVAVVIPNQKVYIRYAAVGGMIFSVGLGVARIIFRFYAGFALNRYNLIYGSFTAAIMLIMWIYYLSNILLLSAEVVAHLQDSRKGLADSVVDS